MKNIPLSLLILTKVWHVREPANFNQHQSARQQGGALSAMLLTQGDHLGQELTHLIHLRSQTSSLHGGTMSTFGKAMPGIASYAMLSILGAHVFTSIPFCSANLHSILV